ncbi:hypothetical protein A7982_13380 [Minicystis rosea]|nr:hypothetical protein A7982_13380 [Minicystis rosea]
MEIISSASTLRQGARSLTFARAPPSRRASKPWPGERFSGASDMLGLLLRPAGAC